MSFNYKKIKSDSEINKLFLQTHKTILQPSYIEYEDSKFVIPEYYAEIANDIENFQVKDSDVFCVSYPKTGTTWTLEMLLKILDIVDDECSNRPSLLKIPFLELKSLFDYRALLQDSPQIVPANEVVNSLEIANKVNTSPRLLKTHLPWIFLPKQIKDATKKPKIIYITRNPKDTCVSFYHHSLFLHDYGGNLEQFCQLFLKDKVMYGSFWNHISSFVNEKSRDNILFITYEDMIADQAGVIEKVCKFLEKELSESKIEQLVKNLKFENMRKKFKNFTDTAMEYNFMRKGIVGSYKDEMSAEMIQKFDEWIEENIRDRNLYDYVKCNV